MDLLRLSAKTFAIPNDKETLNKSFDKLRTNGKVLIPFVVSLHLRHFLRSSNHERNQLVQRFHKLIQGVT